MKGHEAVVEAAVVAEAVVEEAVEPPPGPPEPPTGPPEPPLGTYKDLVRLKVGSNHLRLGPYQDP